MTITVKKIAFAELSEARQEQRATDECMAFIGNVQVECLIRLGTLTLTIDELRQLKQGQTLTLAQQTHEPLDIVLNNQVIARGELMCCEEHFAIQITEVCS